MQLDIPDHLLRNIEKDHRNDCVGSCSKMLGDWLEMDGNASWDVLIKALDKLAENARGNCCDNSSCDQVLYINVKFL